MNNFQFPETNQKPQIAYTEMKSRVQITEIELKKDKNQKDY